MNQNVADLVYINLKINFKFINGENGHKILTI